MYLKTPQYTVYGGRRKCILPLQLELDAFLQQGFLGVGKID